MIVYHGSTDIITNPLVNVGRNNLDFGKGFYVTVLEKQAMAWATRPANMGKEKYLNVYELDVNKIEQKGYKLLRFKEYGQDWLDFVVANRKGSQRWKEFDLIEGGIANDRVFNTVELYSTGLITAKEALQRLRYYKPNNQICIINQEITDKYLRFVKSIAIKAYDQGQPSYQ